MCTRTLNSQTNFASVRSVEARGNTDLLTFQAEALCQVVRSDLMKGLGSKHRIRFILFEVVKNPMFFCA